MDKGKKVSVVGEIQTRSYEAQDGTKRYVTEIIASDVEFLTPNPNAQGGNQRDSMSVPTDDGFNPIDDEELPF